MTTERLSGVESVAWLLKQEADVLILDETAQCDLLELLPFREKWAELRKGQFSGYFLGRRWDYADGLLIALKERDKVG